MERFELYKEEHHWGDKPLDIAARDLPSLKARFLVENLPHEGRVLEIGCGSGKVLNTVASYRPALELEGCDIRPLRSPTQTFRFTLIDPDASSLPYEPATFDALLLVDVLEHLHDPSTALRAARTVLRPSGRVVSFTPLEGQRLSFYRMYRRLLGDEVYTQTKEHVQSYSERSLRELIEPYFRITDERYAYHLLGHFMDATLFAVLRSEKMSNRFWSDNPYYAEGENGQPTRRSLFDRALRAANRLAYAESRSLRNMGLGAAGILLVATPL